MVIRGKFKTQYTIQTKSDEASEENEMIVAEKN